ncbi:TetR family transcriptional regulator [Kribbella orskensis]|uniref:TetR family transcriptional regulator n=1 Tax=Kribbella orskensis TaxID=2512216 RepID=A0ABY2B8Q6_9ACTN|nr:MULTISPECIES: GntR family transcriptional regulator [Kribbella]TCN31587.1 TetR family transcriptional regulator [Kribbella sp. VKM Ac-2500]TCO11932.1 TetR family transcriptional regulator [Kribbella orskensis]
MRAEAAPYQQIAAEIRRSIESGKLRPGERAPSTRALVRDHGIAMATATKVLATLQQEGLVHSRPGVGTVVGPPPRLSATQQRAPEPSLSREEVVRSAIAIADGEGLAALSMRRVATDLGVSTMALYRYVGGKDALVLQMVETAVGDFPFPAKRPTSWREGIETAARLQWSAYRAHLWLPAAISLSRPQVLPNLLVHTDAVLRAVSGFGVDASTSLYAAITVFGYVRGVALNLEPEARAEQDTGMTADEWSGHQTDQLVALIGQHDLAGFRALDFGSFEFDYDLDQLFEFGLGIMLDGLAVKLQRMRAPLR